jgi:pimeloyl-ACP methyl ester carboxylesterase
LTLDRLVLDVIELLDHLGLDSVHLAGNSAGGYLGQQLAMTRPELVGSLALYGSTPGLKNSQAPSWIPQIQAKGMRGFLSETIRDRLPRDADSGLVEWFLDEAARNDPAFIGKFVLLMASYDWSGEVERITCPTMVVIPGAETVGSLENYEPFRRLKDVEFKVYDGLPHNICDAVPDRCARDVHDFLCRRFPA